MQLKPPSYANSKKTNTDENIRMQIGAAGVNHSTASVVMREKLAIGPDRLGEGLKLLSQYAKYGLILSTCNRTEVYATAEAGQPLEESLINFLNVLTGVSFADLLPHIYLRKNATACGHLFRVSSGLDSMIVGEHEILGQVNVALEAAEKAGMVNLTLRNLFQQAISVGRRVREETAIGRSALSISSVAVDLANRALGDLSRCCILVIGAGEAGRLVARAARERGASNLVIFNRSREKAVALARSLGTNRVVGDLSEALAEADVTISCTAAPHMVIKLEQMLPIMHRRPGRPMVIIDIAMPRDIDPEIKTLRDIILYNIDDLTDICNLNRTRRESESLKVMKIIREEADKFLDWWQSLEIKPIVTALIQKAETIRQAQLKLTLKKLPPLSEKQLQSLESMTMAIVTKVLHDPINYLKDDSPHRKEYSRMVKEIFRLEKEHK